MKRVTIYTDGACSGNPGPGGWGCVILADGMQPDESLHDVAIREKITILSTQEDAYTASIMLSKQLSLA